MSAPSRLAASDADRLAAGRLVAARAQPYLASALFALQAVPVSGLGTFAVDRHWRLYVDPEALRRWEVPAIAAVLLHEVAHLVRDHASRAENLGVWGTASSLTWNLAADLAINDDLDADRAGLPDGAVRPADFDLAAGLAEETYYAHLSSRDRNDTTPQREPGFPGASPAATSPSNAALDDNHAHDSSDKDSSGGCGSASDGRARHWEIPAEDSATPGLSKGEAASIRAKVSVAVRHASRAPAGWRRWAGSQQAHPVDWRSQLRAAVRLPRQQRTGPTEVTYQRPSRRHPDPQDVILPARCQPRYEVAVIVDTSGSVSDRHLAAALAQIEAVQRQCGLAELWVIACDTEPAEPLRTRRVAPIELRGGGGTDLRPALALLPRLYPRPDVAIVITDGLTPWPDRPPNGITVIVATTNRPSKRAGFTDITIS